MYLATSRENLRQLAICPAIELNKKRSRFKEGLYKTHSRCTRRADTHIVSEFKQNFPGSAGNGRFDCYWGGEFSSSSGRI